MNAHFLRVERDGDLLVWWLDQPGERHNTFTMEALDEIERAIEEADADSDARAVVVISAKPDSFVVGADVRMLQAFGSREDAAALSRKAHGMIERVRSLEKPVVAAIHGPAMGGGLELALACSMRIASDDRATKLALPEVRLGLLPGGGGTQLLPRTIGIQQALALLLTGKNVYPRTARRIGLVDVLIHRPGLLQAAKQAARALAANGSHGRRGPRRLPERLIESNALTRRIVYSQAADRLRRETRGNYPAPARILECVEVGIEEGFEAGLNAEQRYFADLAATRESRELVRLFFARSHAGKNRWAEAARGVRKIGVLGAGLMGSGIVQVSAENGFDVFVKDRSLDLAAAARRHVFEAATGMIGRSALNSFERDFVVERVMPVTGYEAFANVDLVVEAAPEDLRLKHELIREVESVTRPNCIIASNTSSIPIGTLAEASSRPDQLVGMHYFSPVPRVPLLEIVRTQDTAEWVLATVADVGLRQGKTIIVVNDGPGFYTTRILAHYLNEALLLLDEGAAIFAVDEAMRDFGFPMGPFEIFDLVGLEVASQITRVLDETFSRRGVEPNRKAAVMVEAGFKGRKTRQGFYRYERKKRRSKDTVNQRAYDIFGGKNRSEMPRDHVVERLALVMINEAVTCLGDGVLSTPVDGDVGAVFGLGFPPFRGGPFRYVDAAGAAAFVERLEHMRVKCGDRFGPSPFLVEHASENGTFY